MEEKEQKSIIYLIDILKEISNEKKFWKEKFFEYDTRIHQEGTFYFDMADFIVLKINSKFRVDERDKQGIKNLFNLIDDYNLTFDDIYEIVVDVIESETNERNNK